MAAGVHAENREVYRGKWFSEGGGSHIQGPGRELPLKVTLIGWFHPPQSDGGTGP